MRDSYSLYEAKARLSALVRKVREGGRVVITVHGKPAVELRRLETGESGIAARLAELRARGVLVAAADARAPLRMGRRRRGALKRFLESRD